jgi:hypothetical protein
MVPLSSRPTKREAHDVGCAYRKLDPAIAMMKATENRLSSEPAETLDRPMAWRIFAQGQMRSQFVVIGGVGRQDPAQIALAEDDDVIEALPADRANQPLHMSVLPG